MGGDLYLFLGGDGDFSFSLANTDSFLLL